MKHTRQAKTSTAVIALMCFSPSAMPGAPQLPVPYGWSVLNNGVARGDLNRDGRSDLAIAIRTGDEEKRFAVQKLMRRRLIVFFRQPDGSLRHVFTNATAVLGRDEGGVMGDPFQSLGIVHGALVLEHMGGSRESWEYVHRYRYQAGVWRLIRLRKAQHDRLNQDSAYRETNFSIGNVSYGATTGSKASSRRFVELRATPSGKSGLQTLFANGTVLAAQADATSVTITARLRSPHAMLRLRDVRGSVLTPIASSREGAIQTLRISRDALPFSTTYSTTDVIDLTPEPDVVADVRFEIADTRLPSRRGKLYPAQIVITNRDNYTLAKFRSP
jgi:hypothetical protein